MRSSLALSLLVIALTGGGCGTVLGLGDYNLACDAGGAGGGAGGSCAGSDGGGGAPSRPDASP